MLTKTILGFVRSSWLRFKADIGKFLAVKGGVSGATVWGAAITINLLVIPLMLRSLGKEVFGIRAIVVSVAAYLSILDLGICGGITRFVASAKLTGDSGRMGRFVFSGAAIIGVLGILALFVVHFFANSIIYIAFPGDSVAVVKSIHICDAIALLGIFAVCTNYIVAVLQGVNRIDFANLVFFGNNSMQTALVGAASLATNRLSVIIWLQVATSCLWVVLISLYICIRSVYGKIRFALCADSAKELLRFSRGMLGFRVMATVYGQADRNIIARLLGLEAVAHYFILQTYSNVISDLLSKVSQWIYPAVVKAKSEAGNVGAIGVIRKALHVNMVIGLSLTVGAFIVAPKILPPEVLGAWNDPNRILYLSLVLAATLTGAIAPLVYGISGTSDNTNAVTFGSTITCVVALALYWPLNHTIGLPGFGIAKFIAVNCCIMFYMNYIKRKLGKGIFGGVLRIPFWMAICGTIAYLGAYLGDKLPGGRLVDLGMASCAATVFLFVALKSTLRSEARLVAIGR